MMSSIITTEDINYLAQQSSSQLNLILSGMTSLMQDTNAKIEQMESQKWYQRMVKTVFGKNKATKAEIEKNHDKLNSYMAEAIAELYNRQCIDQNILLSLTTNLNAIYTEHVQLKQVLGAFVTKLNEKIESIENYYMLNTEIEQGVYSNGSPIISICKVLSQMDKRCIQDDRKMDILRRSMTTQNILNSEMISLRDFLVSITEIQPEEAGQIYLELSSIQSNFMASIILKMMDHYHFLPDLARKAKNKTALVQSVIEAEQLDPSMTLSMDEVFDDFVNCKLDMLEGIVPISTVQNNSKLAEAEKLFLDYQLDEAFNIFKELAEKGNGRAMYFLGEYYYHGYGSIAEDDTKAETWKIAGRNAGDILASLNVAYTLPKGSAEQERIFKELFDQILHLSKNGDIFAQNELAKLYTKGFGVEQDDEEKRLWLIKSAERGYWISQTDLGNVYYIELDYEKAVYWYLQAAEQGYDKAQYNLAECYYHGYGVEEDKIIAVDWYRKAAEQGNVWAQYNLAKCLCEEKGVKYNSDEIFKWFKRSAEQGNADAQYELAYRCYDRGTGTKINSEEAFKWFMKSAEQGNDEAQYEVGFRYYKGEGVEKDLDKAFEWLMKSAEQRNNSAFYLLGNYYYDRQNYQEAYKWYSKSRCAGALGARTDMVMKRLVPGEPEDFKNIELFAANGDKRCKAYLDKQRTNSFPKTFQKSFWNF